MEIFQKEMEARMGNNGRNAGNGEEDFLCWLMKNTDYPPEKISDFLLGVLFAGHDTASRAIPLVIYFLSSCPKAVEQLRVMIIGLLTLLKFRLICCTDQLSCQNFLGRAPSGSQIKETAR